MKESSAMKNSGAISIAGTSIKWCCSTYWPQNYAKPSTYEEPPFLQKYT